MEKLSKIAITGYSGSIGIEFPRNCQKLKTRLEKSINKMIFEINNLKIMPETLIHLSALVSTKKCDASLRKANELNVLGSIKWYKASKITGIKNFIFVSTSHVYKSTRSLDVNVNIGFQKKPKNNYGKSKLEAEKNLQFLSKIIGYPNLVIARVFSVYSLNAREGFLINDLFKRKKKKDFSTIYGTNVQRDFIDSKKITEQLIKISINKNKKKIYHICSGKTKTVGEICVKILGKDFYNKCKKKKIYNTNWMSLIGRQTII